MKIFPGMHYTMGGLWVDFTQATNIPGIFAAGECEYQYHGANRLGANSLVSCIFGGFIAGPAAVNYARNLKAAQGNGYFDSERKRQEENNATLMKADGTEMQRSGFTYLLQKGNDGWRIHEIIATDVDKLFSAD